MNDTTLRWCVRDEQYYGSACDTCPAGLNEQCGTERETIRERPPWITTFVHEHKRSPSAREDGITAWLRNEIEYLESVERTEKGDGALSAYKATLRELMS